MILSKTLSWDEDEWRSILHESIRDAKTLRSVLGLKQDETEWLDKPTFEIFVPRPFLARIEPRNPKDPLLLQVAPSVQEQTEAAGYTADPLKEGDSMIAPGVLRKYQGRVLYIVASACPIHCRYCFRRHFPYREHRTASIEPLLKVLNTDSSIFEVILSGGDPLILPNDQLEKIISEIGMVPNVRSVRIHTRFGVVLPQRITPGLLGVLRAERLKIVVVMHVNHPNEIDEKVQSATNALVTSGVTLLNQSVLLKGVNDSARVLEQLSWKLFEIGVLPYYLHLLDKVAGTSHFDLPEQRALSIYRRLQSRVPGYLAPRLVREIPDRGAKTIVAF
ncbi:MAG: EF-P beta-lysylation protein EpmB [Gammaproteobacteria bacterium]|nr:EF-P beta-lysylation protein EpmB [Gammaproteobacteria bacterium]MYD81094.1 EF-P beta-lysylation protein EpmB [Gammaproteobacteria bacterium]